MIDLIKAATLTNDREVQKNAENTILALRNEQTEQFFLETVAILQSEKIANNIRQAAGTLLAVSIKTKNQDTFLWDKVGPNGKISFKDMVLSIMIDKQKNIRRAAANIVAAICCIQIPRKQWPGIAQKITSNISNEDIVVKQVSILTIGFICESLKQFNFDFDEQMQETILSGILLGVRDSHEDTAQIAFKALRDGIPAISQIMKNAQYRDFLINQIAEAINAKKFLDLSLQCLIEFVKHNFQLMNQNYVDGFAVLINPILRNVKQEENCILAMQFWYNFAKEEKNIQSNPNMVQYIKGRPFADSLVESLLQNLCYINENDEDGNGVSESAANALQAIFEGDSGNYKQKVLVFTSNTIKHQNWKFRQASIRAFAALLLGLEESESQKLVESSLLQLVILLEDKNQFVKLSAIKSLSIICEQTGYVILNHSKFLQILEIIVKKIHINQNFMRHACKIIDSLCDISQSNNVNIMAGVVDDLMKVFLEACLEPNRQISSVSNIFTTLMNLVKVSENIQISKKYIDYVLTNFSKIGGLIDEKRNIFYQGFFTLAQMCLMTIRKANGSITTQHMSSLYSLVVDHFIKIKDVESDGYYIVSALAYFLPNDLRLVEDFWKYIEYGLLKRDQEQVFKATISCICDFAAIYRELISSKVDYILNQLLDVFEKNLIHRDLKLDILMCIGELYLHCGSMCLKHLKKVIEILLISCEGVVQLQDQNYAQILQQSVIQTFMCIFHGLNQNGPCQELLQYFVKLTTDISRKPKLDYVKESMTLLSDITHFYQQSVRKFSSQPFIENRYHTLVRYNKNGELTKILSYMKQQFRL